MSMRQSTMERIRAVFAALKTPYFRTTAILSRWRKGGHNPWQTDHAKAMDARRGATKHSRKFTTTLDRWQNVEIYRDSQLVHGWTEEYVKYLDYISQIDISYEALYKQRNRHENTLFMRGVGSNKQAGPLCQRPDYKSSAYALVSIQREQVKILSFNWKTHFSSSSSSTWTESPTWWRSSSWDHQ